MPERPQHPSSEPEADFTLDLDQVFARPVEPVPTPRVKTEAPRNHYKLERKTQAPIQTFGHFAKPSISIPGNVSLDTESVSEPPSPKTFGKKKHEDTLPELAPNRAYEVMKASSILDNENEGDPYRLNRNLKRFGILILLTATTILILKLAQTSNNQLDKIASLEQPATSQEARIGKAAQTLQSYLAAKSWKDKLNYILEPDKLASRFRAYYTEHRGTDPTVTLADNGRPQEIGGEFWFTFNLEETATKRPMTARLQETQKGFRLDWENFIQLGALPWAKFSSERPNDPTQMRVTLTSSTLYEGAYADAAKFQAYSITHISGPPSLTGYVDRSSRASQTLEKATQGANRPTNLNLYLQFEPTASPAQVKIIDMVAETTR